MNGQAGQGIVLGQGDLDRPGVHLDDIISGAVDHHHIAGAQTVACNADGICGGGDGRHRLRFAQSGTARGRIRRIVKASNHRHLAPGGDHRTVDVSLHAASGGRIGTGDRHRLDSRGIAIGEGGAVGERDDIRVRVIIGLADVVVGKERADGVAFSTAGNGQGHRHQGRRFAAHHDDITEGGGDGGGNDVGINAVGDGVDHQTTGSAHALGAPSSRRGDANQQRRGLCEETDRTGRRRHGGSGNHRRDAVADAVPTDRNAHPLLLLANRQRARDRDQRGLVNRLHRDR